MAEDADNKRFIELRIFLDEVVSDLYSHMPVTNLERGTIIKVMDYFGEHYSLPVKAQGSNGKSPVGFRPLFDLSSDIKPQDIGLKLIKDQIGRDLLDAGVPPPEAHLLLNGLLGWFSYNPGTVNNAAMERQLQDYLAQYGVGRLDKYASYVVERFVGIITAAVDAQTELIRRQREAEVYRKPPVNGAMYSTTLLAPNLLVHLHHRMEQLAKKVAGFSPNLGPYRAFLDRSRNMGHRVSYQSQEAALTVK